MSSFTAATVVVMLPSANHVKLTNPLFLRGRASVVGLNRSNQMILFYTPHIYKQEHF